MARRSSLRAVRVAAARAEPVALRAQAEPAARRVRRVRRVRAAARELLVTVAQEAHQAARDTPALRARQDTAARLDTDS
jgi:hypothetical protein